MSWLGDRRDVECCDLTTIGRRTGRPHVIEIWFGVVGAQDPLVVDELCLISGNGPGADWFRNLQGDPAVTVRIEGEVRAGRAIAVTDPRLRRRIGDVMGAKYVWSGDPSIGLTYDAWCYDVPAAVVRLEALA